MNHQRSWANRAIRVREIKKANSVPSIRMAPLFSDCPTVERLMKATAKPAQ
jgi:hypothetical protein